MWKQITLALLLTGCHTTPVVVDTPPTHHPALPVPYEVCQVDWEVLEVDKRAKVSLSYQDNVSAAVCFKDLERFITQLVTVTCHYRQELKESICLVKK